METRPRILSIRTYEMKRPITAPTYEDILKARENIKEFSIRTPLIRLNVDNKEDSKVNIYLKLENLQAIGSFKVRAAGNAIEALGDLDDIRRKKKGICTASAGNFGQGLAWACKQRKIPCTVVVPRNAPKTKVESIKNKYGANVIEVTFEEWWNCIVTHECPQAKNSIFIHPGAETAVLAGNATVAFEILEECPEADAIVVPYGSGALTTGVACGVREFSKRHLKAKTCRVISVEPETAAPFHTSMLAGKATPFRDYRSSFVDGCGGKSVLREIWDLARNVVDGSCKVSLRSVRRAIRILLERNKVLSEGAGACPVAAALEGLCAPAKNIVCVVSGGGLDMDELSRILEDPHKEMTRGGVRSKAAAVTPPSLARFVVGCLALGCVALISSRRNN